MTAEFFGNNTIGWSSVVLSENYVLLGIAFIGILLHSSLWFQLFLHKIPFDLSFVFSLGYLSTDILLLSAYIVQYGIRTHALTPTWRVSCYFEAYFMIYFNILESLCLTALNVCRYWQIVYNRNVYSLYPRCIVLICLIIPALIMINMIVQHNFGWCVVIEDPGSSCSLLYNNVPVRIWNEIVVFALPIIISIFASIQSLFYLKHTHSQQLIVRRNHHRRLTYHFFIFYTIWLILWGPFVFVVHLDIATISDEANFVIAICSAMEMSIDGILVYVLDKRFETAWKKSWYWIRQRLNLKRNTRVHPVAQLALVTQAKTVVLISRNTQKSPSIPAS